MQGRHPKAKEETGDKGNGSRLSHLTSFPFPQSLLAETEGVHIARGGGQGVEKGRRKWKWLYLLKYKQTRYTISLYNPVANKHISNQTASGILQIKQQKQSLHSRGSWSEFQKNNARVGWKSKPGHVGKRKCPGTEEKLAEKLAQNLAQKLLKVCQSLNLNQGPASDSHLWNRTNCNH